MDSEQVMYRKIKTNLGLWNIFFFFFFYNQIVYAKKATVGNLKQM